MPVQKGPRVNDRITIRQVTLIDAEGGRVTRSSGPERRPVRRERQMRREALDLSPVLELIARYRGVEDTVRRAQEHAERAIASIAPFPDSEAKVDLTAAAQFAVTRDR